MLGPFLSEAGHLLLDHARVDAVVTRRQPALGDVLDHRSIERRQTRSRRRTHQRGGLAKHPNRMDEAQATRIDVHRNGSFVHQETNSVVSDQEAIHLLQNATRRTASEMDMPVELMRFQLVVSEFDFPPLVVEHHQLLSGIQVRVQQGSDKAMALPVTGSIGFVQGVLDDLPTGCKPVPQGLLVS